MWKWDGQESFRQEKGRLRPEKKPGQRHWKKRFSAALAACLVFTYAGVPVAAAQPVTKEETVYVNADAAGKVKQVTVSDWLKNAGGSGSLKDSTGLQGIKNIKGEEAFSRTGEQVTWDAGDEDIFYQGTSEKELPVTVEITYYLDGKEVEPASILGKSGKLEIHVNYRNHEKKTVEVNGEKAEIYTPFVMVTGMLLPDTQFTNVEVENGRVVSDAAAQMVIGVAMPGLQESLGLKESQELSESQKLSGGLKKGADGMFTISSSSGSRAEEEDKSEKEEKTKALSSSLKIPESFTVKADVTDFSMGSTFTMAFTDLFSDLDPGDMDSLEELQDALDELSEASLKLVDGSGELAEGMDTLDRNYQDFSAGIRTLQDGAGKLLSGSGELKDGVQAYTSGVEELASGVKEYTSGADQLADGAKQYAAGAGELADGVKQYAAGAEELADGAKQYAAGAGKLADGAEQYAAGAQKIAAGAKAYTGEQGVGMLEAPVNAYVTGVDQLTASVEGLVPVLTGLAGQAGSTTKTEVETLKSGVAAYTAAAGEAYTSLESLSAGLGQLEDGLKMLKTQLGGVTVTGAARSAAGTAAAAAKPVETSDGGSEGQPASVDLSGTKAEAAAAVREAAGSLQEAASSLSGQSGTIEVPVSVTASAEVDTGAAESALDGAAGAVDGIRSIDLSGLDEDTRAAVEEALNSAADSALSGIEAARSALPSQAEVTVDTVETVELPSQEGNVEKLNALAAKLETAAGTVESALDGAQSSVQNSLQSAEKKRAAAAAGTESSRSALESSMASRGTGSSAAQTVDVLMASVETMKQGVDEKLAAAPGLSDLADPARIQAVNSGVTKLADTVESLLAAAQSPALQPLLTAQGQQDLAAELQALKSGGAQLRGGIQKLEQEGQTLADGAEELLSKNTTIQQGAAELKAKSGKLTAGADGVKAASSRLAGGADSVKAAGGELTDGAARIKGASGTLTNGAGTLQANSQTLRNGADTLFKGVTELSDGMGELKKGDTELKDGIRKLTDGAAELSDGTKKMDEEGIQKLKEEAGDGLTGLLDRLDAVREQAAGYDSYAGKPEGMDGSVKFIIATDEVK